MERSDHLVRDAVLFGYEQFGRHVAPDHPLAWTRLPGLLVKNSASGKNVAGTRSGGRLGTSVYISESQVLVFGSADYRDCGFAACGDAAAAKAHFWRSLLRPPTEAWMMVMHPKAALPPGALHLNLPGDPISRAFGALGKEMTIVTIRHAAVAEAAQLLHEAGIPTSQVSQALHLAGEAQCGDPLSDADRKKLRGWLDRCPALPRIALNLSRAEVAPVFVKQYFDLFFSKEALAHV